MIVLSFHYDPEVVIAVKTIDGRRWNKEAKRWEIPIENVEETVEILKPFGFIPSEFIKQKLAEQDAFLEKIKAIKLSDEKYEGSLPLFDFQHKGAAFLKAMPCALLGDVPGLGKSIQTIAATEGDEQVLIFCPASLKYNWEGEIKKWMPDIPFQILVIDGDKEERTRRWKKMVQAEYPIPDDCRRPKYIIANYELLLHDFDLIKDYQWGTIVCDEATRISNPKTQTSMNLCALHSKKRMALTGTPISNSPVDIYGIFNWMIPGYLGTYAQFKKKYIATEDSDWGYSKVVGFQNLQVLSEKVGRFMLRRTKEEVFKDFPPKTVENIIFNLSDTERKMYTLIKEQVIDEIKKLGALDTRNLGIAPVKMLRLKQCTGHTELVGATKGESTKLDTLKELLKPIYASGEKAIVFTQFSTMLQILKRELKEFEPYAIFGEVDSIDRMKIVKEFNDKIGGAVIVMTEAGAYGLNMQSASYVAHYDSPWSIAKLQQREDRAHRIGQNKPVTIYNLIAKNTIDEYILKVLKRKNEVSVDILQDFQRLEEFGMSEEDINEILRL